MAKFLFATIILSLLCGQALAQAPSREEILKSLETKRAEVKALEDQFLSPTDQDRADYAEFLKQPETGMIRLLPRETYDNGKKLSVRGGGAYYSFLRGTHEYGYGSDISLEQKYLSVGFAGADYGLLTTLGDVPLETVTLNNEQAAIAGAYKVALDLPSARVEGRRFGGGTIIDGTTFKSRVPAHLNFTYILRSINYDRTDVLVALKIIRQDNDGSLIIAWKLLSKNPKPELARNTSEQ